MGAPVVHFEILGTDAGALQAFYSELFDWQIDADNPMHYGIVARSQNLNPEGIGVGGGVAAGPPGYLGHVTFYVEVPDVEAALATAERMGAKRLMGPEEVMGGIEIGQFADPEGHLIGIIKAVS